MDHVVDQTLEVAVQLVPVVRVLPLRQHAPPRLRDLGVVDDILVAVHLAGLDRVAGEGLDAQVHSLALARGEDLLPVLEEVVV